ncbi:MAG: hypothetical protein Q7S87_01505 [Agitococcus sp.]|nr:hypothetical protein [Agitococcus sp.]
MAIQAASMMFLSDLQRGKEFAYGETQHVVKIMDFGSNKSVEIHYHDDGEEIREAFFINAGERLWLNYDELKILSQFY